MILSNWDDDLYPDEFSINRLFGDWLRERRKKKGFSIDDVAIMTEISPTRLRNLENGSSVNPIKDYEIQELAGIYGVDERAIRKRSQNGFGF